jgi:hypothetical protein
VLNTSGNGGLLVRSMYYDLHGNIIQSHEQNHQSKDLLILIYINLL